MLDYNICAPLITILCCALVDIYFSFELRNSLVLHIIIFLYFFILYTHLLLKVTKSLVNQFELYQYIFHSDKKQRELMHVEATVFRRIVYCLWKLPSIYRFLNGTLIGKVWSFGYNSENVIWECCDSLGFSFNFSYQQWFNRADLRLFWTFSLICKIHQYLMILPLRIL